MHMSNLLVFGVLAATVSLLIARQRRTQKALAPRGDRHVRVAGRREMMDPPRNWNIVDETMDESFPASDPPATY